MVYYRYKLKLTRSVIPVALVNTTEMFKKAYANGYAIGAFNVNNMEIVQGITEACSELNAPVILQVSAGARKYANHTYLLKLVEAAVKENPHILPNSALWHQYLLSTTIFERYAVVTTFRMKREMSMW